MKINNINFNQQMNFNGITSAAREKLISLNFDSAPDYVKAPFFNIINNDKLFLSYDKKNTSFSLFGIDFSKSENAQVKNLQTGETNFIKLPFIMIMNAIDERVSNLKKMFGYKFNSSKNIRISYVKDETMLEKLYNK